jgi:hypothetical protein
LARLLGPVRRLPGRLLAAARRHPVRAAVLTVVLVVLGGTVVDLVRIKVDLDAGRSRLSDLSLKEINKGGGLVPTVDRAAGRLDRAEDRARTSLFLKVVRPIPVLGNQVAAVRDLSEVAAEVGGIARSASGTVGTELDAAAGEPAARVELLDTVVDQLARVADEAGAIEVGADGWLVWPLADARASLVRELSAVDARVAEGTTYVRALRRMLAGPGNYLILAANNAEMRGGAGMPLSAGTIHIEGGDVEASEFTPTNELNVPVNADLIPTDLRETYHRFALGFDHRETAASPNFPAVAPIYADMAARSALGPVRGVFQVDAVALRALIKVIGPVEHEGVTYTTENVEQQVLNENYLRFGQAGPDTREQRLDLQSEIATAVFDALKERDVPITKLAAELATAARGRHLLAWSSDPAMQTIWRKLGADGQLRAQGLMICVQNIAANKMDWYIDPQVSLDVHKTEDASAYLARMTVRITNPELERTSVPVEGNYVAIPRAHRSLVTAMLPLAAYDITSITDTFTDAGVDGPMKVAGMRVTIERGETRTLQLEFKMPLELRRVLLMPSGRVRGMEVTVNGRELTDARARLLKW